MSDESAALSFLPRSANTIVDVKMERSVSNLALSLPNSVHPSLMLEEPTDSEDETIEELFEGDDDVEAERGQEEYYRDRYIFSYIYRESTRQKFHYLFYNLYRSRWWFHRQQFRARELIMDESDRLREQTEIEPEKRRLEWEQMLEEERTKRTEALDFRTSCNINR